MKRFYSDNIQSGYALLSEEESHHCLQVLRLESGDRVELVNGEGMLWQATIEPISKKQAGLRLGDLLHHEENNDNYCHLAVALTKNAERIEWLLEKATEMGLVSFHPIITGRTERSKIRIDRLEKIAIAAMKQSLRLWKPIIHEPLTFEKWLQTVPRDHQKLIAHCSEKSHRAEFTSVVNSKKHSWVAIGPEGDFTEEEIELALREGFLPVSLGNVRLRVETAALAVCAYFYLHK